MTVQQSNWWKSERKGELPSNWAELREETKQAAGGRCQYRFPRGGRCPEPGTDCDHINGKDDHSFGNRQWLCRRHHQMKTQRESAEARRIIAAKGRHPVERHPGML